MFDINSTPDIMDISKANRDEPNAQSNREECLEVQPILSGQAQEGQRIL